jgi:aldose 1-epimerase
LSVPGLDGARVSLVLGFDDLQSNLQDGAYFGAVCGRYANRIASGRFSPDGVDYTLPVNDRKGPNSLHGGFPGNVDAPII